MEAVPGARRIAVLADPTITQPAHLQALQNAARARGVEVTVFSAGAPELIALTMDKRANGATVLHQSSARYRAGRCPGPTLMRPATRKAPMHEIAVGGYAKRTARSIAK
jgi:hypothetical protein